MADVHRYGPGEEATEFEPGDFILAHRHNPIAGLISLGEKLRFRGADSAYAHWSHCALLVDEKGSLVEAETRGVIRSPISKYRDDEYHLVRLGPDFAPPERQRAVDYTTAQVGKGFGFLALFGAGLFLLFGWPLKLQRRDHQICSELVARALQAGGLMPEVDASLVLPADLAKRFDARP